MIELIWTWRLLCGQITPEDVPDPIRHTVMRWWEELADTITVTMGGAALAAGTGYAYDKATGKVTVYRVSGAVEVAGGAA